MELIEGTKVTVRLSTICNGGYYIITTYSRKWGHSFGLFLDKKTLDDHIQSFAPFSYTERDGGTYVNVSTGQQCMVDLDILWLSFSGDNINGHKEKISIENDVFLDLKEGEEKSFLYKTPSNTTKYISHPGAASVIQNVLKDKRATSALKKYFRDHSTGGGKCVLYNDGGRNFYFKYMGPVMKYDGGIILSDYKKNGWPCMQYTTHT
jgi:hypothetical protein